MKKSIILALSGLLAVAEWTPAVEISGMHEAPNTEFGKQVSYRLTGDTTFGWRTAAIVGDIDLNGHALVMETGGGNHTVFSGAITGQGSFTWHGGGVPQVAPSVLTGTQPNTFSGVFTLANGVLDLAKPSGVTAIPGDLIIGTKGSAMVKLEQSHQINDDAHVTLAGSGISGLSLQGHTEAFASLTVTAHAVIELGDSPASLLVGDSSARPWDLTKTVTVTGFKPGKDQLVFGKSATALTTQQLSRIGFDQPAGLPAGLYTAKLGPDGHLTPATRVAAVNPPFDVSPAAIKERAKLYEIPGIARLTGPQSPLKDGLVIDFFGDSITWQNGFIGALDKAIQAGPGTQGKTIKLVNRGINGGGVLSVRDGTDKSAYPGDSAQLPFAARIAADKADVVVVFIGINDVWWRNTAPEVFEQALRDLVTAAKAHKSVPVLATMTVHGELPDSRNADDPKIEQYTELTRKVARDTGTTLVDLRRPYVAYLQNHNAQLRVDGTLYFKDPGVLTYDGVHPNATGVELLANLIGQGIFTALGPAPATAAAAPSATPSAPLADSSARKPSLPFIPWPDQVVVRPGQLRLATARIVASDPSLRQLAVVLADEIAVTSGLQLPVADAGTAKAGDIVLALDATLVGESYRLAVDSQARVTGGNYQAVALGTVSLLQAISGRQEAGALPKVSIEDRPAKAYRGLLIDVARQYHSIASLKQIVNLCRFYKIRYLQLHLTDDQAFMFPTRAFPKALENNHNGGAPYSMEDLTSLVAYADARGVTIIPEFDIPGHSAALNRSDPDFWMIRGTKPYEHHASINIARDEVVEACTTLIGEMCEVFKSSPYFHIGGDEADLALADQNEQFKAAFKKHGLGAKGQHELYRRFLTLMDAVVKKNGKQTIVWEGFGREPNSKYPIPKDVIVMVYENRFYQPDDLVADGYTVVNSSWTPLYVMRVLPEYTRKIFDWNVDRFGAHTTDFAKTTWRQLSPNPLMSGSQICSWEQPQAVEIANLRWPLAAMSERVWSPEAGKSWPDFQQRLAAADAILGHLVHQVRWTCEGFSNVEERLFDASLTLTMTAAAAGTIRYTLDGKAPTAESTVSTSPLVIDQTTFVRAGLFDSADKQVGGLTEDHFRRAGK
ncbi:MAG: family 20 glycosylhydrolase [Akkermansiaceae bacterium]|nr:family 20 glycosylhydrolase [Akkermansiaceae bacterium]